MLPAPRIHPDLPAPAALPAAHEQRPSTRVEVVLGQREGLLDAQATAPQHNDDRAQAAAMAVVGRAAHHRHDHLDGRGVGRVVHPLVAGGLPAW